jgi:putative tryptophan/tyrosine transport system substrate-binding protein
VTQSVPINFFTGFDPVESGFVASLNRSGGYVTGVVALDTILVQKRLEVLHELVPTVKAVAFLASPTKTLFADPSLEKLKAAATGLGMQLRIQTVVEPSEFEEVFETFVREHVGAIIVGGYTVQSRSTCCSVRPLRDTCNLSDPRIFRGRCAC